MNTRELCELGLNLPDPWYVKEVKLEKIGNDLILHIDVDHRKGYRFEVGGAEYGVYDHQERTWQHLNFFEHRCEIHARVPRVKMGNGKVKLVSVPWASKGSSFTLKYEENVLDLVGGGMSSSAIGQRLGIGAKRVFRILRRYVSVALANQDIEEVKELSVDETSTRRGHNYVTILADRATKKVVGVSPGKDKEAFAHALIDMEVRGGDRTRVKAITMDMSRAYISAANAYMGQAAIVFDRFHIVKKMNEAVDEIRKKDRRAYQQLKGSRYLWLRNGNRLTEKQAEQLALLSKACPQIGEAYRLKEMLKIVLDEAYIKRQVTPLNEWIKEAWKSNLEPIKKFVNMLRDHWSGVKEYFYRLSTNAFAESVNLKIQEIKRTAKGYRNIHNFIIMIYFHLGGLNLKPTIFD